MTWIIYCPDKICFGSLPRGLLRHTHIYIYYKTLMKNNFRSFDGYTENDFDEILLIFFLSVRLFVCYLFACLLVVSIFCFKWEIKEKKVEKVRSFRTDNGLNNVKTDILYGVIPHGGVIVAPIVGCDRYINNNNYSQQMKI